MAGLLKPKKQKELLRQSSLHMHEDHLRHTKERREGSLKSGHHIRHEELQDHNSKTQAQCFEDSHGSYALESDVLPDEVKHGSY